MRRKVDELPYIGSGSGLSLFVIIVLASKTIAVTKYAAHVVALGKNSLGLFVLPVIGVASSRTLLRRLSQRAQPIHMIVGVIAGGG